MSNTTPGTRPGSRPPSVVGGAPYAGAPGSAARGGGGAAPGAGLPAGGRLRSDYTRPPSAGPGGRTPLRGAGKDALLATPTGGAAPGYSDGISPSHTHINALYGLDSDGGAAPAPAPAQQQPQQPEPRSRLRDQQPPAAAAAAARKAGAPAPALATHGDLWAAADQDGGGDDGEPLVLEVRAPSQASHACDAAASRAAAAASRAAAPPQCAALVLPAWLRGRPFSTGLHLAGAARGALESEAGPEAAAPDLRALPEAVREAALVDDLLYCFMGVPGRVIRPVLLDAGPQRMALGPAVAFAPAAPLDERSAELVRKLLPLAEYAAVVERFTVTRDSPERGMVVEALASELRALLEKWRLLVVQLERRALGPGGLGLSELLFQCQAPMASLRLAAEIAAEASSQELTSAGLLNLLHRRLGSLGGDAAGRALVERLLAAAAAPYFEILGSWLAAGVLDDPYSEFMVKEDTTVGLPSSSDDQQLAYWAQRYTLRADPTYAGPPPEPGAFDGQGLDVPAFLWPCREAILTTGKYLNAVRECGAEAPPSPLAASGLSYDAGGAYLDAVRVALDAASGALLRLMLGQGQLMGWLRSIKHFFLLDQGDLLVHLLEGASEELSKPASEVSRPRLRSLLELAARTSSVASDPRLDNLQYTFDARGLAQLVVAALAPAAPTGEPARPGLVMRSTTAPAWQVLLLDLKVDWPVSLVVSRRQMLQYQVIFKHLFQLKFAERQLNTVWAALQPTRGLSRADQERFRPWHTLCRGLTHVLTEYLRYVTTDVIEPLWMAMEERIARARDIDEVMRCHQAFLLRAADGALLTQLPILKCVVELQRCAHDLWREGAVLSVRGGEQEGVAPPRRTLSRRESSFDRALAALREVARDAAAGAAVAALSARFDAQLAELTERLGEHYQRLLSGAGPGPRAASAAAGAGAAGGAAAAMSTREELDSLLNLIERIDVRGGGGGGGSDGVAAVLAGVRLA
ncbi:gamma-tubulin complex component [Raphidocelis subcapitata]|uniref:Gamma-tubulin complex component n=1 Tax=Raphidocelis subcapitata TaxID=307507 RepID=A0A2V0P236_9CHLO|nr:gamma-tubulin complex component [Raphidocelis subcapitata]|eukprot:GBF91900.1 gamma-tubulin complex component [Raphidocelis subcapitata]